MVFKFEIQVLKSFDLRSHSNFLLNVFKLKILLDFHYLKKKKKFTGF